LLVLSNKGAKALNVIEKAWVTTPHADLARLYLQASGTTDGLKKVAKAEHLLVLHPGSADGHIAVAEAALEAKLWGQARANLQAALDQGRKTRSVYTLMARLEDEERGDKDQMRSWLTKAAMAAADPAWVCGQCGHVETQWQPHCPKCKTIATFAWQTPPGYGALDISDDKTLKIEAPTP
jgi:HemY protein